MNLSSYPQFISGCLFVEAVPSGSGVVFSAYRGVSTNNPIGGVSTMALDEVSLRKFLRVSPKTPTRSLLDEWLEGLNPTDTTQPDNPTEITHD
jgi:hypothetical protein